MTGSVIPAPATTFGPTLSWLIERAQVDPAMLASARAINAVAVAEGADAPEALVRALVRSGAGGAGCRIIACALPPRESVWWGWASARHASRVASAAPLPKAASDALDAGERWIKQPDEDNRCAAWAAAQAAGLETAPGSATAACFFTGGSIAPPGSATIPPPAGLHCTLSAAAIMSAAATDPDRFEALLDVYIDHGIAAVAKAGGWAESVKLARRHFDSQREVHAGATGAEGSRSGRAS
jgi:hypothetical protein